MENKKIDELKEKYESIKNSKTRLKYEPVKRLEEIAKFANEFDEFMTSQGYIREATTNFDSCGRDEFYKPSDFWFQYEYNKEPITDSISIGIAYEISSTERFWIFSYKIKNKEKIDLFEFLKSNYTEGVKR